jgi:hypothetical protein
MSNVQQGTSNVQMGAAPGIGCDHGEMSMKTSFLVTKINNAQTLLWNKYQTLAWILIEVAPGQKTTGAAGSCPTKEQRLSVTT